MAHKLEIRTRGDGRLTIAGPDLDVMLDGRPLEWTEVELVLKPGDIVTARLTLLRGDLSVDVDVLVALQAMADKRTEVVIADRRAEAESEGG